MTPDFTTGQETMEHCLENTKAKAILTNNKTETHY